MSVALANRAAAAVGAPPSMQRHLMALLAMVKSDPNTLEPGPPGVEEIVFDIEFDGSRYLLVRMPTPQQPRVSLSPREQEIARMVAAGHPSKTIAYVLNISAWTVGTHLRRIFAKLGVKTRAAMVARLLEIGLATHACLGATELDLDGDAATAAAGAASAAAVASQIDTGIQVACSG